MRFRKLSVPIHHLRRGLADDDETHDDGLLGAPVCKELFFAQAFDEAASIRRGLMHVIPDACDRGNQGGSSRSYRLCLGENLIAELQRQIARGQQINMNAKQVFQFGLQAAKVEQRCAG